MCYEFKFDRTLARTREPQRLTERLTCMRSTHRLRSSASALLLVALGAASGCASTDDDTIADASASAAPDDTLSDDAVSDPTDSDAEVGTGESGDTAGDPIEPGVHIASGFTVVESFDDIAAQFWFPVEVDGQPVAFPRGAHWTLTGSGDSTSLSGTDGCNGFGTVNTDESTTSYVDGVLVEFSAAQDAMDCPDIITAMPAVGDRFLVDDTGTTLMVMNGDQARVVLELQDAKPSGDSPTPAEELSE